MNSRIIGGLAEKVSADENNNTSHTTELAQHYTTPLLRRATENFEILRCQSVSSKDE